MTESRGMSDTRIRVLLVDDEDSVRDSLYSLLERSGYDVLAASNGLDGLAICRQSPHPIDLLVTDYNMPHMSGLELARECSHLCCDLSVLYISGSRPDEDLQADLRAPKRGFLVKPFRGVDLVRKARELLLVESPGSAAPERLKHSGCARIFSDRANRSAEGQVVQSNDR
jgi:CheY-like chemotaxis protein